MAHVRGSSERHVFLLHLLDDTTPFIRKLIYDLRGNFLSSADVGLDGTTPYVVAGTVTRACCI